MFRIRITLMRITIPLFTLMWIRIRNRTDFLPYADPVPNKSDANLRQRVYRPPLLHWERLWPSMATLHFDPPKLLNFDFEFDADPDPALTLMHIRIRVKLFFTLMRIRIRLIEIMRSGSATLDRYIEFVLPWRCWLALPSSWWNSKGTNQRFKSCSYGWGITWKHNMFPKDGAYFAMNNLKKSRVV